MSDTYCDDGRCGRCALCQAMSAGAPAPGALERVRLGVDLVEPNLATSLVIVPVVVATSLVVAASFDAAHGVSNADVGGFVAIALALLGAAWACRARAGWALLVVAPLALLTSITHGSLALGSLGCAATELALQLPGALVGLVMLRRRHASLAGWAIGLGAGGVIASAAVHFGCPNYQGMLHVIVVHALPGVLWALFATALARRVAASVERRRAAA